MTVTERAAAKAVKIAEKEGKPKVLRVGVRGGGCSGLSYFMDFTDAPREGDIVTRVGELTVVCDPKSASFLQQTTLDYETNLLKSGFKFENSAAKSTCSCGESFSA